MPGSIRRAVTQHNPDIGYGHILRLLPEWVRLGLFHELGVVLAYVRKRLPGPTTDIPVLDTRSGRGLLTVRGQTLIITAEGRQMWLFYVNNDPFED